jgi:hypothetical protein
VHIPFGFTEFVKVELGLTSYARKKSSNLILRVFHQVTGATPIPFGSDYIKPGKPLRVRKLTAKFFTDRVQRNPQFPPEHSIRHKSPMANQPFPLKGFDTRRTIANQAETGLIPKPINLLDFHPGKKLYMVFTAGS